jgi:hypothetical protein
MQSADLLRQFKTIPFEHWMFEFSLMPNQEKKDKSYIYLLSNEEDMKEVNEFNDFDPTRVWTVASAPNGLLSITEGKDSSRVFPLKAFGYLLTGYGAEKNIKYIIKKKFENQEQALNFLLGDKNGKKI